MDITKKELIEQIIVLSKHINHDLTPLKDISIPELSKIIIHYLFMENYDGDFNENHIEYIENIREYVKELHSNGEVVFVDKHIIDIEPYCDNCGEDENIQYNEQYANGEYYTCKVCGNNFFHNKQK